MMGTSEGGAASVNRKTLRAIYALICVTALLMTGPVTFAQPSDTGVPDNPPLTQDQLDKAAQAYYDTCTKGPFLPNLHDCSCLTEGYKQLAIQRNSTQLSTEDQYRLGQTCPASKETISTWVYKTCDDAMKSQRTDHAAFCGCAGNRFATEFRSHPDSNLRKVSALKSKSLKDCGPGD